jgi:hypothetical protein
VFRPKYLRDDLGEDTQDNGGFGWPARQRQGVSQIVPQPQ